MPQTAKSSKQDKLVDPVGRAGATSVLEEACTPKKKEEKSKEEPGRREGSHLLSDEAALL